MNLAEHIRLAFSPDRAFCRRLSRILGFCPRHPALYREAFEHSSITHAEGHSIPNNERLEYLGDAILDAISADILFHRYPTRREGFLTTARSRLVQRSTLGRVGQQMGLGELLHVQTSALHGSHNSFLTGNAVEALIGAIYLDRGYYACYRFIERRMLGQFINVDEIVQEDPNHKSRLLEWCQHRGLECEFILLSETTNGGSPVFRSAVDIAGIRIGEGSGYTKKESHQQAAGQALRTLHQHGPLYHEIISTLTDSRHSTTTSDAPVASHTSEA